MTGPSRIMSIRHAGQHAEPGVTVEGRGDEHSLTVRGRQRAGALVCLFGPDVAIALRPDVVYASAIGPGSETRRPRHTVGPLVDLMRERGAFRYEDRFLKPDSEALIADVLKKTGTVLIASARSVGRRFPTRIVDSSEPAGQALGSDPAAARGRF